MLLIRVWVEADGVDSLRARITQTLDLDRREESSIVVATRAAVVAAVEDWLDAFLRDGALTEQ